MILVGGIGFALVGCSFLTLWFVLVFWFGVRLAWLGFVGLWVLMFTDIVDWIVFGGLVIVIIVRFGIVQFVCFVWVVLFSGLWVVVLF